MNLNNIENLEDFLSCIAPTGTESGKTKLLILRTDYSLVSDNDTSNSLNNLKQHHKKMCECPKKCPDKPPSEHCQKGEHQCKIKAECQFVIICDNDVVKDHENSFI